MAFASSVGLGFRQGTLRTTSKSFNVKPICLSCSNVRLFSSLMLPPTCTGRRPALSRVSLGSRNFSIWGWGSSPKPTTPPASELPKPSLEETNSSAAAEAFSTTPVETTSTPATESSLDAASSVPLSETSSAPEAIINSADAEPVLSGLTDTLVTHAPAALQYGDLAAMGLISWTPAGLVRWSMEIINVTFGLPWFWTIVAGSVFWRLFCVPFAIKGLQTSARMQPHQAELMAIQENLKKSQATKNPLEVKQAALALQEYYKKHDINPLAGLLSLIQLPITLGMFFGVQKLCKLPVEQLKDSGFSLLPDLTVPDPTYIMPLALCAMINAQIIVGARDINTTEKPDMGHFMNVFRILTIPGVLVMANFPSGLLVSLMTTAILTTLQSLVLRIPAVRQYLGMPIVPRSAQGQLPSFGDTFRRIKSWLSNDINNSLNKARKEAVLRQQAARRAQRRSNRF